MKRQIRRGVFETNSSSVHSLTMCAEEEYLKWKNDEILYWEDEKFGTREEIIEELKDKRKYNGNLQYTDIDWENKDVVDDIFSDEQIKTYKEFFDNEWFVTYSDTYTTSNGETIIAFGYYGHD